MNVERDKVRCLNCELMQWSDRANCRRCGQPLPEPVVKIVERVVEKVVARQDPHCVEELERACRLISAATDRLNQSCAGRKVPVILSESRETESFPTMAEMERSMILAAYERSERKPLVAARLLGIGKTTFYRKLKEMGEMAA
jgi:transcriptional regulator of acetoin/glycerol metabolism